MSDLSHLGPARCIALESNPAEPVVAAVFPIAALAEPIPAKLSTSSIWWTYFGIL